ILSTFLAAFVIFLNTDSFYITNKPIVYCGDISYVLYLVHWPVIVATRYYCDTQHLSISEVMFVVACSLLISIVAHHTVESYFISNGFVPALICVAGCYLYVIGTAPSFSMAPSLGYNISNTSKQYAISWNLIESGKVYFQLPCQPDNETPSYTHFTQEPQLRCV
ncbi:hypothetical protein OSTOST_21063, partial [Ostertagia ostertagi]